MKLSNLPAAIHTNFFIPLHTQQNLSRPCNDIRLKSNDE